jgi:hypothetical protein
MQKKEIQYDELRLYISELRAAVEVVCQSPPFRASAKSGQFLRHIVQQTLNGNVDELKERLIGIALLGRDASYDTGSDAGVRVRANDVRKRLATYYAANSSDSEFTLEVPAGSYVPHFYLPRIFENAQPGPSDDSVTGRSSAFAELPQARALSLQQLALPTLVALFLCVICLRWQLAQEHPFVTFWNTVFQDHHALLYVPLSPAGGQQEVVPVDRLEDTAPLFNLAGQFHTRITLTRSLAAPLGAKDILILVGAIPASSSNEALSSAALVDGLSPAGSSRLVIDDSPSGRRIVDRRRGNPAVNLYGRAALLTIVNGPQRSIHVDGTDEGAIDSLIEAMCEPNAFPDDLIDSFQDGTVTQIVLPMEPSARAVVFHESLSVTHAAMHGPL